MIPQQDPIALTQALVRCESVTPVEGGALTLLENVLQPAGFTCHRLTFTTPGTPDVENLYARIGNGGPHLCFAGHTDVVPPGRLDAWSVPPFAGEIRDGILYGRGAVDMKGGVACFVAAALDYLASQESKFHGSLSFLITGDEEGPSINGTMKLLEWLRDRDEQISACLVGEPSNPEALGDEIKIGRRGSINAEVVVHGRQGHSAYPQKADNPIPKLARIIDRLSSIEIDRGTAHFQPSNLQTTVISAPNSASNVIPAEARAIFNVRYNDTWNRQTIEAWLREQVAAAAATLEARYDIDVSGTGDVFLTSPKGTLVEQLVAAIRTETGRTPALTTGGGTSDARFIKDLCPVVEFGPVNKTIHAVDEHVPVAELTQLTAIYRRFIEGYFSAT
ncbi:succinyl-diaminopimelate desuccinylase [Hyphomicrobium sp.]|uniref:succinyl-diaminopimelate desuccinylase n=1 Tax=Hyphomicrobium sp. TaxID=82 RepID=UPI002C03D082|nr:succinyl-diaminopimelate desuccinylase [Hyphomicrobium sp.]HRN89861.1 succinyl-diaminopimelate desuccinylase [Hyphomicrobium sp.]HRQ28219.1 succinyl-diaminopimelate desuccinylase [Hyphomicrobium sp.]